MLHPHDLSQAVEGGKAKIIERIASAIESVAKERVDDQGRDTEIAEILNAIAYKIRYPED